MVLSFGSAKDEDVATLIAKKNYGKAIEAIKKQLQGQRPNPSLRLQLGDVLVMAGKSREAVAILTPLADEFAREGFAAKAISILKKIQKIDPSARDVDAKLASLIQEKQRQATVTLPPPSPGGMEIGMEEIGFEPMGAPAAERAPAPPPPAPPAPVERAPAPRAPEKAPEAAFELPVEMGFEAAPEVGFEAAPEMGFEPAPEMGFEVPAPERAPKSPAPKPPARAAPPPTARPRATPPAEPEASPTPVVDRDLVTDEHQADGFLLDAAEPSFGFEAALPAPARDARAARSLPPEAEPVFNLEPEPLVEPEAVFEVEPEALPEPVFAVEPLEQTPLVEPQVMAYEGADLLEIAADAVEVEPEPALVVASEPGSSDAIDGRGEGEMSESLFAEELLSLVEGAFDNFPMDDPSPGMHRGDGPGGGGNQIVVSPLFKDFSVDELVAVIQGLNLLTFEAGEIIITEGDAGQSLYMLTSGTVKALKKNQAGRQVTVGELSEGAFFGEMSILSGKPRTATVVAASHCELLELDRATLDGIVSSHPRVLDILKEFAAERAQQRS